ncbi:pilus assembly protein, partial [Providencia stuartii]
FNYTKQSPSSEWKKTEDNRSIYQFNWTNKEKGLAMVSVKYL